MKEKNARKKEIYKELEKTNNFYSSLFYNSEIWLSQLLDHNSKQSLLSALARALPLTMPLNNRLISNALQLYKLFNTCNHSKDWIDHTNQIVLGTRQEFFSCIRVNNYKIRLGSMVNKSHSLNGKIKPNLVNDSYPTYKF